MFDADLFKSTQVEGENATEFTPIPEAEYRAMIEKVDFREAKGNTIMDVTWLLDDPSLEEVTGRDKNTVRQSVFLDLSDSGGLAMGKGRNVQLGRLREALGQNGPEAWSPSMLEGSAAMVLISHRMHEQNVYTDVKSIAAL